MGPIPDGSFDETQVNLGPDSPGEKSHDSSFRFPTGHDGVVSVVSEGNQSYYLGKVCRVCTNFLKS